MTIDVFTATGTKKSTLELSKELFEARINQGLMHQAVMLQQSNRRNAIAHAKNRGEVQGSTRKLYSQKHTGQARRGSIRSPLLRGGGKAFGPRNNANFIKDMPKSMRRSALLSCLSYRAKHGAILGLESYPSTVKTKDMVVLLKKLPVEFGRSILLVVPERHEGIEMSARNIQNVKTLVVSYLNAEDLLHHKHIIFLTEAIEIAEKMLTKKEDTKLSKMKMKVVDEAKVADGAEGKSKKPKTKTTATKKKKFSATSASSDTSASSK